MIKQIARFLLMLTGWKVDTEFPVEAQRCVMVAAPHTTNWDFYYVRLAFWVLGVPMKVAIKDDWTKFPFGWFTKPLGAVGVDRGPKGTSNRKSQVEAMSETFDRHERIALVIAPEGTRKLAPRWKNGYYWIAHTAQVPITCGYLDYEKKIAGVGPVVVHTTGDLEKDLKPLMDHYRDIKGKYPAQFQLDERYCDNLS